MSQRLPGDLKKLQLEVCGGRILQVSWTSSTATKSPNDHMPCMRKPMQSTLSLFLFLLLSFSLSLSLALFLSPCLLSFFLHPFLLQPTGAAEATPRRIPRPFPKGPKYPKDGVCTAGDLKIVSIFCYLKSQQGAEITMSAGVPHRLGCRVPVLEVVITALG